MTWETSVDYCEKLAKMIDFRPDIIVGISRGGLVPARILSDILNVKILILGIKFYKNIGETSDKPTITQDLPKIEGKKILIVDDIADSGKSLLAATEYLKGNELRTATLHYKTTSKFKPDYYIEIADAWIVYPWERHETGRLLKSKGF